MSNELQIFNFESNEIRTFVNDNGEPWWVASDVCRSIGLQNVTEALRPMDADHKGFKTFETPGGRQTLATVNEPGLYQMIFRSNKEEAKRFRRWVLSEVLPSIRKTGRYVAPGAPAPAGDPTLMMLDIIREGHLRQLATEREVAALGSRTAAVEARVEAAMAGDVEEVSFMSVRGYCRVHGFRFSKGAESIIGTELTRRCKARGVGVGNKPDETWGRVNIYPMAMLEEWRAGLPLRASKP